MNLPLKYFYSPITYPPTPVYNYKTSSAFLARPCLKNRKIFQAPPPARLLLLTNMYIVIQRFSDGPTHDVYCSSIKTTPPSRPTVPRQNGAPIKVYCRPYQGLLSPRQNGASTNTYCSPVRIMPPPTLAIALEDMTSDGRGCSPTVKIFQRH